MGGRGKKKRLADALSTLIRERPLSKEDREKLSEETKSPSDRAAALVIQLQLEDAIVEAISFCLPRHDKQTMKLLRERNAPLDGFSAQLRLAYSLGIIDKETFEQLELIRKIRNAFAHAGKPVTFSTPAINDLCMELSRPKRFPNNLWKHCKSRQRYTLISLSYVLTIRKFSGKEMKRYHDRFISFTDSIRKRIFSLGERPKLSPKEVEKIIDQLNKRLPPS